MSDEARLLADLDTAGIAYTVHEHEAVFTVEESADLHERIPGAHTKNLFLKNGKDRFWLVTMPHDRRADLKFIGQQTGAGKLSFAKPEHLLRLLGVTPGSVTPLGAINDVGGEVSVVLDAAFDPAATISVHPLRNTATLVLGFGDLVAMLERWGHAPQIVALQPEVVAG
ncbi:prolyl-tRNA synthetase associated domain-containing protein [soil metagenome]